MSGGRSFKPAVDRDGLYVKVEAEAVEAEVEEEEEIWSNDYSLDRTNQMRAVEEISAEKHTYEIEMGGTLDGFNTAAYFETYSGFMRMESKFKPNEYVAIENVGDCDVVAPRVVVNGRRNWHSAEEILEGILDPGMTEAEKAMAIWKFTSSIEVQCHDNNKRVGPPFPRRRARGCGRG